MKRLVEVTDDGMESLIGQNVTLFCVNYIYTGKLIGVNATCVMLKDPSIVYETGAFAEKNWKFAERVTDLLYIQVSAIESFGVVK